MQYRFVTILAMALAVGGCASAGSKTRSTNTEKKAPAKPTEETLAYTRQGQAMRVAGELETALQFFQKALDASPQYAPAHLGIGEVYQAQGNFEKAEENYQAAVNIDPGNFDANYKLGLVQHLLNKLTEAVASYLNALTIDPDNFAANANLATAYMQLGQARQALPYAERCVKLRSDSQHARVIAGGVYAALGRDEEAVDAYRGAVELGELTSHIALNLAEAHLRMGFTERASNVLQTLLQNYPDDARALERMGYIFFREQQFDKSLEYYEKSLAQKADDAAALNGLGVNLMTQYLRSDPKDEAQHARALDAWQKSLQANASQPRISELIAKYKAP